MADGGGSSGESTASRHARPRRRRRKRSGRRRRRGPEGRQEVAQAMGIELRANSIRAGAQLSKINKNIERRGSDGASLLLVGPEEDVVEQSAGHSCVLCGEELKDKQAALNHTAYHLMCTLGACSTILTAEPCPLCLGDCKVYLYKTSSSSSLQPRICCKVWAPTSSETNLGVAVSFSMALMEKCSTTSPTMNRPVRGLSKMRHRPYGNERGQEQAPPSSDVIQRPVTLGDGTQGRVARPGQSADCARTAREGNAQAPAWEAAHERGDAPVRLNSTGV